MKNEYLFIDLLELILGELYDAGDFSKHKKTSVEDARRKIMQLIEKHLTK